MNAQISPVGFKLFSTLIFFLLFQYIYIAAQHNIKVTSFLLLLLLLFYSADCGSVVNNTLKSPNYPEGYPHKMECNYSVPIPAGTRMKIKFQYFKMPDPYPVGNELQCL